MLPSFPSELLEKLADDHSYRVVTAMDWKTVLWFAVDQYKASFNASPSDCSPSFDVEALLEDVANTEADPESFASFLLSSGFSEEEASLLSSLFF